MDFLEGFVELVQEIDGLIVFASIIWGAAICFFGYRIFRIVIAIIGFLVGAAVAGTLGLAWFHGETLPMIVVALVGGFVGAALATLLYFVGVFLLGAAGGALIGTLLSAQIGAGLEPIIVIILAIIGGIVAIILQKLIIIVCTSFGGSWSVVSGVFHFTENEPNVSYYLERFFEDPETLLDFVQGTVSRSYIALACWILLGICGVAVQYKTSWGKEIHPKRSKSDGA